MTTVPTQIRINETVKAQATSLFNDLGMDMSGAINIFFVNVYCAADFLSRLKFQIIVIGRSKTNPSRCDGRFL